MNKMDFRFAEEKDVSLILSFIKELAIYEKMQDAVIADEEKLRYWLFEKKAAEVIFALDDGKEAGFVLFYHNFSTFLGKAGIYIEDLYIKEEYRNRGLGKGLMSVIAEIAVKRNCGRIEWSCLNWNKSSIGFYLSLGALPLEDFCTYRLCSKDFQRLSADAVLK